MSTSPGPPPHIETAQDMEAQAMATAMSRMQAEGEGSLIFSPISKAFILTARDAAEGAYSDAHHDFAQGWLYHSHLEEKEPLGNRPTLELLDFTVDKSLPIKTELAGRVGHKPEDKFLFDNLFDERYFDTPDKRNALGRIFSLCNMSKTGEEMKDTLSSQGVPGKFKDAVATALKCNFGVSTKVEKGAPPMWPAYPYVSDANIFQDISNQYQILLGREDVSLSLFQQSINEGGDGGPIPLPGGTGTILQPFLKEQFKEYFQLYCIPLPRNDRRSIGGQAPAWNATTTSYDTTATTSVIAAAEWMRNQHGGGPRGAPLVPTDHQQYSIVHKVFQDLGLPYSICYFYDTLFPCFTDDIQKKSHIERPDGSDPAGIFAYMNGKIFDPGPANAEQPPPPVPSGVDELAFYNQLANADDPPKLSTAFSLPTISNNVVFAWQDTRAGYPKTEIFEAWNRKYDEYEIYADKYVPLDDNIVPPPTSRNVVLYSRNNKILLLQPKFSAGKKKTIVQRIKTAVRKVFRQTPSTPTDDINRDIMGAINYHDLEAILVIVNSDDNNSLTFVNSSMAERPGKASGYDLLASHPNSDFSNFQILNGSLHVLQIEGAKPSAFYYPSNLLEAKKSGDSIQFTSAFKESLPLLRIRHNEPGGIDDPETSDPEGWKIVQNDGQAGKGSGAGSGAGAGAGAGPALLNGKNILAKTVTPKAKLFMSGDRMAMILSVMAGNSSFYVSKRGIAGFILKDTMDSLLKICDICDKGDTESPQLLLFRKSLGFEDKDRAPSLFSQTFSEIEVPSSLDSPSSLFSMAVSDDQSAFELGSPSSIATSSSGSLETKEVALGDFIGGPGFIRTSAKSVIPGLWAQKKRPVTLLTTYTFYNYKFLKNLRDFLQQYLSSEGFETVTWTRDGEEQSYFLSGLYDSIANQIPLEEALQQFLNSEEGDPTPCNKILQLDMFIQTYYKKIWVFRSILTLFSSIDDLWIENLPVEEEGEEAGEEEGEEEGKEATAAPTGRKRDRSPDRDPRRYEMPTGSSTQRKRQASKSPPRKKISNQPWRGGGPNLAGDREGGEDPDLAEAYTAINNNQVRQLKIKLTDTIGEFLATIDADSEEEARSIIAELNSNISILAETQEQGDIPSAMAMQIILEICNLGIENKPTMLLKKIFFGPLATDPSSCRRVSDASPPSGPVKQLRDKQLNYYNTCVGLIGDFMKFYTDFTQDSETLKREIVKIQSLLLWQETNILADPTELLTTAFKTASVTPVPPNIYKPPKPSAVVPEGIYSEIFANFVNFQDKLNAQIEPGVLKKIFQLPKSMNNYACCVAAGCEIEANDLLAWLGMKLFQRLRMSSRGGGPPLDTLLSKHFKLNEFLGPVSRIMTAFPDDKLDRSGLGKVRSTFANITQLFISSVKILATIPSGDLYPGLNGHSFMEGVADEVEIYLRNEIHLLPERQLADDEEEGQGERKGGDIVGGGPIDTQTRPNPLQSIYQGDENKTLDAIRGNVRTGDENITSYLAYDTLIKGLYAIFLSFLNEYPLPRIATGASAEGTSTPTVYDEGFVEVIRGYLRDIAQHYIYSSRSMGVESEADEWDTRMARLLVEEQEIYDNFDSNTGYNKFYANVMDVLPATNNVVFDITDHYNVVKVFQIAFLNKIYTDRGKYYDYSSFAPPGGLPANVESIITDLPQQIEILQDVLSVEYLKQADKLFHNPNLSWNQSFAVITLPAPDSGAELEKDLDALLLAIDDEEEKEEVPATQEDLIMSPPSSPPMLRRASDMPVGLETPAVSSGDENSPPRPPVAAQLAAPTEEQESNPIQPRSNSTQGATRPRSDSTQGATRPRSDSTARRALTGGGCGNKTLKIRKHKRNSRRHTNIRRHKRSLKHKKKHRYTR